MAKRTNWVAWGLVTILAVLLLVGLPALGNRGDSAAARQNALSDAIRAGNVGAVEALLRRGVGVDTPGPDGVPPLMAAIMSGHSEIVKVLLDHGAQLRAIKGATPLGIAAMWGNAATIRLLLAHGARVNERDRPSGWTPLIEAAVSALGAAPDKRRAASVEALLAAGANPNLHDSAGMTALMWAGRNGQTTIVRSLIAYGADVNAKDKHGMTALIYAAAHGSAPVVKLLLAHGADVNAREHTKGETALDFARANHPALVPLLNNAKP